MLARWVKQALKDAGINMNISRHIQHAVLGTVKLKLTYHLKPSLKQAGGGATGRSQGLMANQVSMKNSIVLVYSTVKNDDLCQTLRNSILGLKCLIYY